MARYMYGKPLQFVPGTQNYDTTDGNSYCNFGYLLLGMVVEKGLRQVVPGFRPHRAAPRQLMPPTSISRA